MELYRGQGQDTLVVGTLIIGGGANRVLYENASQQLATDSVFTYDDTTDTLSIRNILGGGGGLPLTINTPALHSIGIGVEGTAYWNLLATGSGYTAGTLAPNIDTTNQFGAADLRIKQVFTGPGTAANPAVAVAFASTQTGTGLLATAANTLGITAGGTLRGTWSTTGFQPNADNSYNLGGPSNRWGVSFFGAGAASAPSVVIAFAAATGDQGFYSAATGEIDVTTGGTLRASWTSTGYTVATGVLQVPSGSVGTPSIRFAGSASDGLSWAGAHSTIVSANGVGAFLVAASGAQLASGGVYGWSSGAVNLSNDTSFSRAAAGVIGITSTLRGADGTASAPTYAFTNETNTGWYLASAGNLSVAIAGTARGTFSSAGLSVVGDYRVSTDNARNLGTSGNRMLTIFAGPGSASAPSISIANVSGTANDGFYATGTAAIGVTTAGTLRLTIDSNGLTLPSGHNIVINTTTGTKIGTGTTQLIGFWNATPVVQQVGGVTITNNVTSGGTTNTVDDVTAAPVDTNAASLTSTRNAVYQLARKVKLLADALRTEGLLQNADA